MLAIAEPRAKPKAQCFDRPCGTDLPFASFPSTSYWATFTESLRDKSPHHRILALKLTRMGGCRTGLAFFKKRSLPEGRSIIVQAGEQHSTVMRSHKMRYFIAPPGRDIFSR
jgi:hypothetical protein